MPTARAATGTEKHPTIRRYSTEQPAEALAASCGQLKVRRSGTKPDRQHQPRKHPPCDGIKDNPVCPCASSLHAQATPRMHKTLCVGYGSTPLILTPRKVYHTALQSVLLPRGQNPANLPARAMRVPARSRFRPSLRLSSAQAPAPKGQYITPRASAGRTVPLSEALHPSRCTHRAAPPRP